MSTRRERLDLFPTPVFVYHHPDPDELNAALTGYLFERMKTDPGLGGSNIGGWHSDVDLHRADHPAPRALHSWVAACWQNCFETVAEDFGAGSDFSDWTYEAWAMVIGMGHYSMAHDHAESLWSGVYYVDAGDPQPSPSGRLGFMDPRLGIARSWPTVLFQSIFSLDPEPGALVLFPAWLRHAVFPYTGGAPRVSIAYNFQPRRGDEPA